MILNYVLLFVTGFLLGGISVIYYFRKKMNMLRADLLDKTLITKLIKEHLPRTKGNPFKKRYNGRSKKKKAN